jgi:hypothetical protein
MNKSIAEYEAKTGAQPFDMTTGKRLEKVTRQESAFLQFFLALVKGNFR